MGRLDDAAKRKVVELRKAGLSFRKIKAVLELENIKVSAQAIYYFLREFQGRPPGRVRPFRDLEAGSSTSSAALQPRPGSSQESWSLQCLRRGVSHHTGGFAGLSNFAKQSLTGANSLAEASGSSEVIGSSRLEQQQQDDKEESDIQIVSVTSLAQSSQQINLLPAETSITASSDFGPGALLRRRITASSATRSMLAARRRILDKALSQRIKQVASSLRRDHVSPHSAAQRNAASQPSESYDLTTEPTQLKGQPAGLRRFLSQRPAPLARPPHALPRIGIRPPNQPHSPLTSAAPRLAPVRLQTPGTQTASRSDGTASPQQASQEAAGRSGVQDQIQSLGCEMRSLGLAVKMLVEQQMRMEKEQVQQTAIQRQILSTLQGLASRVGSCTSAQQQQHHSKTPSPSRLPLASGSMSVSQDTFGFGRGTYAECSRAQATFNSLESLDGVETFKLPELSPASINGFPPCSSDSGTHPLAHTSTQNQQYTAAYQQQGAQTVTTAFAQPFASAYNEPQSRTFLGSESKRTDFPGSCPSRSLPDCSMSAQQQQQDQQISAIKVEGP